MTTRGSHLSGLGQCLDGLQGKEASGVGSLEKRSAGRQRLIRKAMAIGMTLAFFKRMHKNLRILNKKAVSQILKNDYTENWVTWSLQERHGRKTKRDL